MKLNAPEKIYLDPALDALTKALSVKTEADVEYTSTDTFIEKAWDWIEDNLLSSNQQDKSLLYYEQFKNYMKGK